MVNAVDLGFAGEVADFYASYRRGYPAEEDRRRYRDALTAAGYEVSTSVVEYTDELDLEHVIGGVYSALPLDRLPTKDRRPLLEERIRRSLEPHQPFPEHVRASVLRGISSRTP